MLRIFLSSFLLISLWASGSFALGEVKRLATLTDEEIKYLNAKKTITYCVDPKWMPYEAIDENGNVFTGLDVTHKAWSLVGVGWLYAPLRWPVISTIADIGYKIFAKHRYQISYLLTGKKRSEDDCQTNCERKLR